MAKVLKAQNRTAAALLDRIVALESRTKRLQDENRYLKERVPAQGQWIDNLRSQVRDLVDKKEADD